MSGGVPSMSGDPVVWLVIALLGVGTFLIRWSFLGALGRRPVPVWAQRLLRYTAVSVLPALAAPLVVWPQATQGHPDPMRIVAAAVTVGAGVATRNTLAAILCGGLVLTGGYLLG